MDIKKREVPIKNYIILFVIILFSILLLFYLYLWYLTYEESKLNLQIMDRYLQVINYNELDDYIEENKYAIIYASVLNDQETRDFELDFKEVIISNSLKKELLYLDLTDVYNSKNKILEASKKYSITNKSISDVPCFLVFKEGNLVNIYDVKENNYSINDLKDFLLREGVNIDD